MDICGDGWSSAVLGLDGRSSSDRVSKEGGEEGGDMDVSSSSRLVSLSLSLSSGTSMLMTFSLSRKGPR